MFKSLGCGLEGGFGCPLEYAKHDRPRGNPRWDHPQPERGLDHIKSEDWVDVFAVEELFLRIDGWAEVHEMASRSVGGETSHDWVAGFG